MVVAYEVGMALLHRGQADAVRPDLAAKLLLGWFFSIFGATGYYLPGLALVVVLLCWHVVSSDAWRVEWAPLIGMAAESLLLALPLLALNQFLSGRALGGWGDDSIPGELLLSVGAGIYEELVFRLIFISLFMLVFKDLFGLRQNPAAGLAVVLSSLAFAAHHYYPVGSDAFSGMEFLFRALAGGYLAGVFVFRGFGIAVGSHAVYDVIVALL